MITNERLEVVISELEELDRRYPVNKHPDMTITLAREVLAARIVLESVRVLGNVIDADRDVLCYDSGTPMDSAIEDLWDRLAAYGKVISA